MTVASAAEGDQLSDRQAALAIEVLAVGRRVWGASWTPQRRVVAPGRIELLGNHLDYNGGKVLAAAIDRCILLLGANGDTEGTVEVSFADPEDGTHAHETLDVAGLAGWERDSPPESPSDYVRGAIAALLSSGRSVQTAYHVAFGGNVPVGLGVSSSAALSVGLVTMLSVDPLAPRETILLAQAAENRAGVGSGTMDQAASVAGGVIRYDAAAVEFERLEPILGDLAFVVVSSGVVHRLGESAYPVRVREMGELLAIAREQYGDDAPAHAAELTEDQVSTLEEAGLITDVLARRARHVMTEVRRVDRGYDALVASDWASFGALMTASGRSSATDYDISHPQVEELVGLVRRASGVLGARMMGGGGGGSVLALIGRDDVEGLTANLDAGYYTRHGLTDLGDRVLVCTFSGGAQREELSGRD